MKHISDMQELITQVASNAETRKDVVTPDFWLRPNDDNSEALLTMGGSGLTVTERAHRQLAQIAGVHPSYYDKCRNDDTGLLIGNVNHWLTQDDKSYMVRTLNGKARAILSNSYKRIDNDKVLSACLPVLREQQEKIFPLQSYMTDDNLSMKFLHTGLSHVIESKRGSEKIQPFVTLSNSETGLGYYQLRAGFYNGYCLNGCIFNMKQISELAVKRMHKGSRLLDGILSDQTLDLEMDLIANETRDILSFIFSEEGFLQMANRLDAITNSTEINPQSAQNAIKILGQKFQLTNSEREQAYIDLLKDADYTQWGIVNAVTKQANIATNNDRIGHLESTGGKLIDLNQLQWNNIVNKIHAEPIKVLV